MHKCWLFLFFCLMTNYTWSSDAESDTVEPGRFDGLKSAFPHRRLVGEKEVPARYTPPSPTTPYKIKPAIFATRVCTALRKLPESFACDERFPLDHWAKLALDILAMTQSFSVPEALASKWVSLCLPLPVGIKPDTVPGYNVVLETMSRNVNRESRVVEINDQPVFLQHIWARNLMRAYTNANSTQTCHQVFIGFCKALIQHPENENFAFNTDVCTSPPNPEIKGEAFLNLVHAMWRMNQKAKSDDLVRPYATYEAKLKELDASMTDDDKRTSLTQYRPNELTKNRPNRGKSYQSLTWQQLTIQRLDDLLKQGVLSTPWWRTTEAESAKS